MHTLDWEALAEQSLTARRYPAPRPAPRTQAVTVDECTHPRIRALVRERRARAAEAQAFGDPEAMTQLIIERVAQPHVGGREILRWTATRHPVAQP